MSKARYYCVGEDWVDTESYDDLEDAIERAQGHVEGHLETCTADVGRYEIDINKTSDMLHVGHRVWTEGVDSSGTYFIDFKGNLYHHHEE